MTEGDPKKRTVERPDRLWTPAPKERGVAPQRREKEPERVPA